jgi:hypothetical protein
MFVEETQRLTLREARNYARLIIMERSEERASYILRRSHKLKMSKVFVDLKNELLNREAIKERNAVMWIVMRKTNVVIHPVVLELNLEI